jgi:hypothetical protein
MSKLNITLKVSRHSGIGTWTLTEKHDDDRMAHDCDGDHLRFNSDAASFYRAVARYLHVLHSEGHNVVYEDVTH